MSGTEQLALDDIAADLARSDPELVSALAFGVPPEDLPASMRRRPLRHLGMALFCILDGVLIVLLGYSDWVENGHGQQFWFKAMGFGFVVVGVLVGLLTGAGRSESSSPPVASRDAVPA